MKGVIVWSILITAVIATDGENDVQEGEKKGPGCKYNFYIMYSTFFFNLMFSLSPIQLIFKK
jgi:hypothetical protein